MKYNRKYVVSQNIKLRQVVYKLKLTRQILMNRFGKKQLMDTESQKYAHKTGSKNRTKSGPKKGTESVPFLVPLCDYICRSRDSWMQLNSRPGSKNKAKSVPNSGTIFTQKTSPLEPRIRFRIQSNASDEGCSRADLFVHCGMIALKSRSRLQILIIRKIQ